MIKIKTADLKTFLKRGKTIKQPGLMPILSYFKMDCTGDRVICTDTNMHTYLIHEMPGEFEKNITLLIDRKTLQSVVDTTTSEDITIHQKGKKITISDNLGSKQSDNGFQTDDASLYPQFPEQNKTTTNRISPELMKAIQVAKHFCWADKASANMTPLESIHLTATPDYTEVFASNKSLLYVNRIEGDNVEFMMTPANCDALNGFTEALHYQCGNYDFFECGATTFGFIKSDYKIFDYSQVLKPLNREKFFTIEKQKILDYCNRVKNINPSNIFPECEIRDAGKNQILCYYNNADHDVNCEVIFDVEKNFHIEDFKFSADTMIQLISALPYEKITFVQYAKMMFVLSDEDKEFKGIIMGLL